MESCRYPEMKLVVFAHTPPPMHGQSYMVQLMLDGFRADGNAPRIYHIDAKLSESAEAIGKFKWAKLFLLLKYCLMAWWHRFAHGAKNFYYIPAPGKRNALYRDWIVLALCRPLFERIIFHWHAVGLGEWVETQANPWEQGLTKRLLGGASLSIVLSNFGRADATKLSPHRIEVVPNGIPDPCPDFEDVILPERQRRLESRRQSQPTTFTVLYVGACSAAKGLFATMEAISLVKKQCAEVGENLSISLAIAGDFSNEADRLRFKDLSQATSLKSSVRYFGFLEGDAKYALFREADCLCFPSIYAAEGQPVTIIEALAFGLPVVATRWRGIPELLAGTGSYLIDSQDPEAIANGLLAATRANLFAASRETFLSRHKSEAYVQRMAEVLQIGP